uniref:Uncharacterized protein n=1 Tax=Sipha flava TaxID=143950 RepID=A0A2S2QWK1_9HEMI
MVRRTVQEECAIVTRRRTAAELSTPSPSPLTGDEFLRYSVAQVHRTKLFSCSAKTVNKRIRTTGPKEIFRAFFSFPTYVRCPRTYTCNFRRYPFELPFRSQTAIPSISYYIVGSG